ncbi:DNA polymerase III subunit alpha [Geodermatophilus obscurus]|uniref:DNA polymerase III subunit alpha n=1 Tax=Geodermatophilus obscurus (strain ATCC 25078 / DSM 43160 / JCM 3152 / CCUG 61914 / KCC A-0152 / KCTC 9177 / NBRC 13315 / NRRL B-3577 / G-20) TaxID=526225 RepID=D2SA75_GEOOG|nr:DNA polymerase III subunit alpha [Geodermatophilus obscurus]ADB75890.1 DNA polymerase III, alpha subunit [Geodermatophilus obscurus DSM 43160]
MRADPFVHLHVASGYSMQYGANHPADLVERAAEHGMRALALTDRDGLYGAVKFALACRAADVRPLFGVDLAVTPSVDTTVPPALAPVVGGAHSAQRARSRRPGAPDDAPGRAGRRSPARGGASVDPRLPRVTFLARDGAGWRSLCRLTTATHLRGTRGEPVSSLALAAEHAPGLVALLGPDSPVGRALAAGRADVASARLAAWRAVFGPGSLVLEVVHHRGRGDRSRAQALLRFAAAEGVPAVLTNAVRYVDALDAPTADVLDAARRLVPLDARHVDRRTAEGHLKSGKEMAEVAEDLVGPDRDAVLQLLERTARLAEQCAVDVRADLGVGSVRYPELEVVTTPAEQGMGPSAVLRARCEAGLGRRGMPRTAEVARRLDDELEVIDVLGYPSYFLTVADVVDLIKSLRVRAAARGSGAGSLVTYLLGISDVDPIRYGLLMERFLSPLRHQLPDVDIDVESARRMEVYDAVLDRFGAHRVSCISMMDTYRVRHAIRDVGAALGLPPAEVDAVAKAFPHIRANQVHAALKDLPELRASRLGSRRGGGTGDLDLLFDLVARLDGLPRHIALHPCGVLLSDATLLDRTPVENSYLGYPMSQFDKDDVEELGLLKLDLLGIRMQSAIAHALDEVARVDGETVDIDAVPRDDPTTFELIRSTRTLGMFQIESPGQRELVGKFGPETFEDIVIDISLFRPGPVKSDMVTPFLLARNGWREPVYPHPDLAPYLEQTAGVVVFHEQVLQIVAQMTGCDLAQADEARRALGDRELHPEVRAWFVPEAVQRYPVEVVEQVWQVLVAFGSFGFCKAHAAAFALPTYQSAWLKTHHPAAFLAGVLTHDPGMYPKRLILDDARNFGVRVLGLDVNASAGTYRVERLEADPDAGPEVETAGGWARPSWMPVAMPDPSRYGIRLSLSDVKGICAEEVERVVAGQPYRSLTDFWHRASVSRPVVERLVLAGGFDSLYGFGVRDREAGRPTRGRRQVTRRDLLLQIGELDRWSRSGAKAATTGQLSLDLMGLEMEGTELPGEEAEEPGLGWAEGSGLPELTDAELVRAELEVLGLDASRHVVDFYRPFLAAIGAVLAGELLGSRSGAEVLVAGVKVATQTPPIRSGRRVVFVTLDDGTGCTDSTFFEDAQGPYASTVFHSWLLVIRGVLRRTGPRGVSLRATGAWELPALYEAWETGGLEAVAEQMAASGGYTEEAIAGAAASRGSRPVVVKPVLVHPTGFRMSPYADIKPAGEDAMTVARRDATRRGTSSAPRKLWHSSPGSSGH